MDICACVYRKVNMFANTDNIIYMNKIYRNTRELIWGASKAMNNPVQLNISSNIKLSTFIAL